MKDKEPVFGFTFDGTADSAAAFFSALVSIGAKVRRFSYCLGDRWLDVRCYGWEEDVTLGKEETLYIYKDGEVRINKVLRRGGKEE